MTQPVDTAKPVEPISPPALPAPAKRSPPKAPPTPIVHDTSAVPTGSAITYPKPAKRKFPAVKKPAPGTVPAQAVPNKTKPKAKPWFQV